ncbi:hypothetical protein [Serratia proteamaculans]|uniref:hypothetical protein n=1 Tax=Serratia proteamaculans TaxID=28151 RepID=UPI003D000263
MKSAANQIVIRIVVGLLFMLASVWNLIPTVDAIRDMAGQLRKKAAKLDELASEMTATGNLYLAGDAANVVTSPVAHMQYLVDRPLAAMSVPQDC